MLITTILLMLSLCACGSDSSPDQNNTTATQSAESTPSGTTSSKEETPNETTSSMEDTPTETALSKEDAPHTHSWAAATCTAAKTCSVCKATEGKALAHNYKETSSTNGHKIGSTINYSCSLCGINYEKQIKEITVSANLASYASINGWYSSVTYRTSASGGYGELEYKYEIFTSDSSSAPSLTIDFSKDTSIGWSNRFYCNGHVLQITVRDEAGNTAVKRITV